MHPTRELTTAAKDTVLDQAGEDILCAVENDWRRMCGNSMHNTPLALDPYRMDLALPHMFILQRTAPGAVRLRVAGQKLHDMIGADPRGMSFGAFFSTGSRDTALELVDAALTLPAIIRIPLTAPRGFGRKPVLGEALLLPLRDAQGELTRVIGVVIGEKSLKLRSVEWQIDASRPLHCDVLEGQFPDRRNGPRAQPKATKGLRLVVDNTRNLAEA